MGLIELLLILWLGFIQLFSPPSDSLLMQIKAEGELRVAARGCAGETRAKEALECELARRFAGELGVRLAIVPVDDTHALFHAVERQAAHFAALDTSDNAPAQSGGLRHLYPGLETAPRPPDRQGRCPELAEGVAWTFPRFSQDDSLFLASVQFFNRLRDSGEWARLLEPCHSPARGLNWVDRRAFERHIAERLPLYRDHFQAQAVAWEVDWRLLAAIGYQESHWNPEAVSPTGVRGLMMLTEAAAEDTGVLDRHDAEDSIAGGARYFSALRKRLPARIAEPDRTRMALAAYNMGLGHVLDARGLARELGGNPDSWEEVGAYVGLLSKPYWYSQTRHGYARGYEALHFVRNVGKFYDILVSYPENDQDSPPQPGAPDTL